MFHPAKAGVQSQALLKETIGFSIRLFVRVLVQVFRGEGREKMGVILRGGSQKSTVFKFLMGRT
jgi:hypothetical protein